MQTYLSRIVDADGKLVVRQMLASAFGDKNNVDASAEVTTIY
jgi:hypothetical protein